MTFTSQSSLTHWHDMNVETCHFVQRVENDRVLPCKDSNSKRPMAEYKISFEPGAAKTGVRRDPTCE